MKPLKQALSILLTPLLVLSAVTAAASVVAIVVVASWQEKLDK